MNFRNLRSAREDNSQRCRKFTAHYGRSLRLCHRVCAGETLMSWGIVPESMMATALRICGCVPGRRYFLEDSLRVPAVRAQKIEALAPGARWPSQRQKKKSVRVHSEISMAGINGKSLCVVAVRRSG
jgi:hypothetical protein